MLLNLVKTTGGIHRVPHEITNSFWTAVCGMSNNLSENRLHPSLDVEHLGLVLTGLNLLQA